MSMFVQYAPYELRDGSWDEQREAFADRCFDVVDEYAPNFKGSVIDRQVLAPPDLERVFNLTGGNIFQGAMTPGQLFAFRPVPGYARYRTPVRGQIGRAHSELQSPVHLVCRLLLEKKKVAVHSGFDIKNACG